MSIYASVCTMYAFTITAQTDGIYQKPKTRRKNIKFILVEVEVQRDTHAYNVTIAFKGSTQ